VATIPSQTNFPTAKQVPEHSILDYYNKQTYLGNQYVASVNSTVITGTTEQALMTLSNPNGNKISVFLGLRKLTSLSAAGAEFRVYSNPTISSAGTVITPVNLRTASGSVSVASVHSLPTASANGTYLNMLVSTNYNSDISNSMLILDPGQSILITAQMSATGAVCAELSWYEL